MGRQDPHQDIDHLGEARRGRSAWRGRQGPGDGRADGDRSGRRVRRSEGFHAHGRRATTWPRTLLSVDLAIDKAYTAAAFGMPTHAWFEFIKDDPPLLHGIVKTPRLIVFGGGYPIEIDGAVVGAIGVSGGHYSQDMEVAQAGLAALA